MYAKCFCSLKKEDKRTRCSNGCSSEINETSILGSAPKLFVVCMACNTSSTVYWQTPNELPYFIYLDSFIQLDPSHLEAVNNIYSDNAEIPCTITEREIFSVLKLHRLNGDVIDSFICSLLSTRYIIGDAIPSILSQISDNMSSWENRSIFYEIPQKKLFT